MFWVISGKGLSTAQVANLRQHWVDLFLVIWNSTSCKLASALELSKAQVANLRQHQGCFWLLMEWHKLQTCASIR
jgi:hypothetical protein